MIRRCDLVPQYKAYKSKLSQAIQRVLESGRYILAEEVGNFEMEFSKYVGVPHSAGVANATDGLILCLRALGVGKGDEVITTPFTAIPTVSAIVASGATPVFVDISPDTYLLDLNKVEKALTRRTKAILPVHIFGNVLDVPKLKSIVGKKIPIIEDAAQAHGSHLGRKMAGSMGDFGVFSFYPTKNLGGYGDGGLVVTPNKTLIEKIKLLRMYGMADKDHIVINGVNSRLDELQAAVLRIKLQHLEEMNENRNKIAEIYKLRIKAGLFTPQKINKNVRSNYHVFAGRVLHDREQLIQYMEASDIQTNVYYPLPLHLQKALIFLRKKKGDFPHAEKLCQEVIALPMYPELENEKVEKVVKILNKF